jgi:hypothetical protein
MSEPTRRLSAEEYAARDRAALLEGFRAQQAAAAEAERRRREDALAGDAEGYLAAADALGGLLDQALAVAVGSPTWLELLAGAAWVGERAMAALDRGGQWLHEQVRP